MQDDLAPCIGLRLALGAVFGTKVSLDITIPSGLSA